jgi:hypothetical protein
MNAEQIIAEIEWLEQLFRLPDKRPLQISEWRAENRRIAAIERLEKLFRLPDQMPLRMSDWNAKNQKPNVTYTDNPRFSLWRPDDV